MTEVIITDHAVERFVKRHASHLTHAEAKAYLEERAPGASPLKERTIKGQQQWVLDDPYCVLVMKPDRRGRHIVCVTILPQVEGQEISEEELELIRTSVYAGDPTFVDRILAQTDPVDLIKPSINREVEEIRVSQEKKLWNRILNIKDKLLAQELRERALEAREREFELAQGVPAADIVKALRILISRPQEDETLDLLESIHPNLVTKGFLRGP